VSTIDLNQPPPGHKFSVAVEKEETPAEAKVRLGKDVALFAFSLMFFSVIAGLCLYIVAFSTTSGAEEKKWAQTVLGAAAGGLLGFVLKK
jgi:hypothetical protein